MEAGDASASWIWIASKKMTDFQVDGVCPAEMGEAPCGKAIEMNTVINILMIIEDNDDKAQKVGNEDKEI